MKKLIAMLLTVLCTVPMVIAQESVSGVVVDKKGNPLPGVRIEISGSSDWTVSDLDGTFTITGPFGSKNVQATYAGMNTRKVKLKDGMRIKMGEANWWNRKPDKWNWFVNAIVALPNNPLGGDLIDPSFGLMIGRIKQWGYYVKGVTNTFSEVANTETDMYYNGLLDKRKSTYWSVTGGGMVRLGCPIYLYAGAGVADYSIYYRSVNGNGWVDFGWQDIHGNNNHYDINPLTYVIDLGLMLKLKNITVTIGTCLAPRNQDVNEEDELITKTRFAGNFGIGYTF